jgi:RHS repeat-associated protein
MAAVLIPKARKLPRPDILASGTWKETKNYKSLADLSEELAEFESPNNLMRSFTWDLDLSNTRGAAGGVGGLVALRQESVFFPQLDGNGNILKLDRSDERSADSVYEYGPFGELLQLVGTEAKMNAMRFSTKAADDITGEIHFENRDLVPSTGKWSSRDPLGEFSAKNLYEFSENDPISRYDLFGLTTVGQILDAFLSSSTMGNMWIMDENDEYTGRVRHWDPVVTLINRAKEPLADPDADGGTNFEEMIAGTNPTNAASRLTLQFAIVPETSLTLNWQPVPYRFYELQGSVDLTAWRTITNVSNSSYTEPLSALNASPYLFYRLLVSLDSTTVNANGLPVWEEALYEATFGTDPLTSQADLDGDGLPDAQEFQLGRDFLKKDHPAVGLSVFTPLEK